MSKRMTLADTDLFFARLSERDPEPIGELDYINSYTLLVAVVLSAQATDVGVNKATGPLFAVVDTPEKMVALGEEGLKSYIRTIGLFNSKAKNVIELSRRLIAEHDSEVPQDRDAAVAALPRNVEGLHVLEAKDLEEFAGSNRARDSEDPENRDA